MEIVAARSLNSLHIYLDIMFLLVLAGVLLYTKRYLALIVGLIGGVIYFFVDYGIFYALLGTRVITGADPFWFLLWLSMSYGFTNFAWIWLWLDNDGHKLEWSIFIIAGWLCTAMLSQGLGQHFSLISIARGTSTYHGVMALLLFVGYALLCIQNIRATAPRQKAPLLSILAIGVLVQGAWELVLLLTGIRPAGVMPLLVNALLETNMGLPYLYWIHGTVSKRYREDLKRRIATVPEETTRQSNEVFV